MSVFSFYYPEVIILCRTTDQKGKQIKQTRTITSSASNSYINIQDISRIFIYINSTSRIIKLIFLMNI